MIVNPFLAANGGSATDPLFANVVLLLDMETGVDGSTSYVDRSGAARTVTGSGGAQVDTAIAKYGTRSLLCDGTGDSLGAADAADLTLGTSDWCFETWIYFSSLTGNQNFFGQCDASATASTRNLLCYKVITSNLLGATIYTTGGTEIAALISTTAVTTGVWYHYALQRSGSDFSLHIDGVLEDTASSATTITNSSSGLGIGRAGEASGFNTLNGHIDELRYTIGATRYPMAGNFTPPGTHPLS